LILKAFFGLPIPILPLLLAVSPGRALPGSHTCGKRATVANLPHRDFYATVAGLSRCGFSATVAEMSQRGRLATL